MPAKHTGACLSVVVTCHSRFKRQPLLWKSCVCVFQGFALAVEVRAALCSAHCSCVIVIVSVSFFAPVVLPHEPRCCGCEVCRVLWQMPLLVSYSPHPTPYPPPPPPPPLPQFPPPPPRDIISVLAVCFYSILLLFSVCSTRVPGSSASPGPGFPRLPWIPGPVRSSGYRPGVRLLWEHQAHTGEWSTHVQFVGMGVEVIQVDTSQWNRLDQ